MVSTTEFPVISVANIQSDFDNVAAQLFEASCKWGFFIATDHGISNVDQIFDLVSEDKLLLRKPAELETETSN